MRESVWLSTGGSDKIYEDANEQRHEDIQGTMEQMFSSRKNSQYVQMS